MLCALPLLFNDAFFDINRFKVNATYDVIPVLAALMLLALLLKGKAALRGLKGRAVLAPLLCMLLFALSCVISCALAGFEKAVLTGEEGRYCGLWFTLCCCAAFFTISLGALSGRGLMPLIALCAAGCALLGVLNAMGIDPLGFYVGIKKGQEQTFMSTIGHFDFFGTFIVLMFALTAGFAVFDKRKPARLYYFVCAAVMAFGASASRTDSSFLSKHLACYMLAALSGGSYASMARALLLWAVGFASLPIMNVLLTYSPYHPAFSGLPLLLCEKHIAIIAAAALAAAAMICVWLERKGARAPGQKRLLIISFILLLLGAVLLISVVAYFTVAAPEIDLGGASSFLRFNDEWGSLRGFVYTRSLRAYSDYSLTEKLFGRGMDLTLRILRPYFDKPEMLVWGVFNDTHCQPLQYLLTCGVLGMLSYIAFYLTMLVLLLRYAGKDPLLCGALCAIMAYGVILLINVTQPILIATYFSISALAVSRVLYLIRVGREPRES